MMIIVHYKNSGVILVAQSLHIFSAKDNKPVFTNMTHDGVIEDIWELDYTMFHVFVFRYIWVENNNSIKVGELELVIMNLNKEGHKDDTFILASQTK